uniref:ABC transporter domain-containing protein n=1 Tax=Oryza punctata TaxID=4537 RepID=A0A0E0M2B6_ORYPU
MASEPQLAAVPRWTPSPRRRQDDDEADHKGAADMVSVLGASMRGTEGFPFGSGRSFQPPPFLPPAEAEQPSPEISVERSENDCVAFAVARETSSLRPPDQGVVLAWEDLWVSTAGAGGNRRRVPILCGLNGYARPGEVLAIMGPSGCGKSTLLDVLAGRLGSSVRQKGDILINGRRQKLAFGTSIRAIDGKHGDLVSWNAWIELQAYVTQDDVLMNTLTVREAVRYSAQLQLPSGMNAAAKRERAEETLREMGLEGAADTRIGGWAHKGISGGQRRRVSICMEILTRPALLFLDEPTSGLDSAASYHVVSRIARMARREGMTVVAAVHQPSTEVFGLFHGLCLLAYGKTVFFGPAADTNQFFARSGFPCPSLMNPSDHFLRTINKDFDKDIEVGLDGKTMTTSQAIDTLVNSYKSSVHLAKVMHQIEEIRANNEGCQLVKKEKQPTFLTQSWVLTKRSFVNMYRDLGYYWLRFAIYVALCLCVGTIYYDVGQTYGSIQARGSMLMFVAAFLTFMAIGGFPSFVEDMKIFGRERLNGHYGVASFVIANTLSSTPYLALISVVPGAIAYYLTGLQSSGEHFGYFAAVLFTTMMVVEGLMMIVASAVPDFLMGIITGAGVQGVMMLNGGFFRLPNDLPKPVWKYPMYYIAFHKYANQGFYKNEFLGLAFPKNNDQAGAGAVAMITGEEILKDYWQVQLRYSKWVDLAILVGMVVLYRVLFFVIVKLNEKMKPMVRRLRFRNVERHAISSGH